MYSISLSRLWMGEFYIVFLFDTVGLNTDFFLFFHLFNVYNRGIDEDDLYVCYSREKYDEEN